MGRGRRGGGAAQAGQGPGPGAAAHPPHLPSVCPGLRALPPAAAAVRAPLHRSRGGSSNRGENGRTPPWHPPNRDPSLAQGAAAVRWPWLSLGTVPCPWVPALGVQRGGKLPGLSDTDSTRDLERCPCFGGPQSPGCPWAAQLERVPLRCLVSSLSPPKGQEKALRLILCLSQGLCWLQDRPGAVWGAGCGLWGEQGVPVAEVALE